MTRTSERFTALANHDPAQRDTTTPSIQFSGFHLDPEPGPHIFEHDGNRLDDQLIGIGLAIDDDLMLRFFSLLEVQIVLAGESVVSAAIPGRQHVGVALPRSRQLSAGQCLNIDEAVGVGICAQIHLSARGLNCCRTKYRCEDQGLIHRHSPL